MLKVIFIMDHNSVPSETGAGSSANASEVAVHAHRPLTAEEEELLKYQDTRKISERRQSQLESEARKHWDLFYKRNSTKFFKDRHWTLREFQELSGFGLVRCEMIVNIAHFDFVIAVMHDLNLMYHVVSLNNYMHELTISDKHLCRFDDKSAL